MKLFLNVCIALVMSMIMGSAIGAGLNIDPFVPAGILFTGSLFIPAQSGVLMSTVAGVFTETTLQKVRARAAAIGMDERIKQ